MVTGEREPQINTIVKTVGYRVAYIRHQIGNGVLSQVENPDEFARVSRRQADLLRAAGRALVAVDPDNLDCRREISRTLDFVGRAQTSKRIGYLEEEFSRADKEYRDPKTSEERRAELAPRHNQLAVELTLYTR